MRGELEGRPGKKQFEIASLNSMVDTHGNVILLEINMGLVLRDSHLDPDLHDDDMITSAFEIVFPCRQHVLLRVRVCIPCSHCLVEASGLVRFPLSSCGLCATLDDCPLL